jgi:alanine dehydrogenase
LPVYCTPVVTLPYRDPVMGVRVALLSVGVLARSQKENERRLAIHPRHLDRIDASLRGSIYLEQGYGERFGMPDEKLAGGVAGLGSRERLLADCDVVVLPKPLPQDLRQMRAGQVLWGWPHCVQNSDITQLCIIGPVTARSTCTCSTRTTNWPATARCCTPCS